MKTKNIETNRLVAFFKAKTYFVQNIKAKKSFTSRIKMSQNVTTEIKKAQFCIEANSLIN